MHRFFTPANIQTRRCAHFVNTIAAPAKKFQGRNIRGACLTALKFWIALCLSVCPGHKNGDLRFKLDTVARRRILTSAKNTRTTQYQVRLCLLTKAEAKEASLELGFESTTAVFSNRRKPLKPLMRICEYCLRKAKYSEHEIIFFLLNVTTF